jgi:hypothetical protein
MHINQTSLVIMLVMVQQVQMVQISLVLTLVKVQHLLITQILVIKLVIKHQMLFSNFCRQAGYSATSAGGSNFGPTSWLQQVLITQILGDNAGFKQQMLIVQISLTTSW